MAKVAETTARIAKYSHDRQKEKDAEEQEFKEGAHASGASNNQSAHNASGSVGRASQSAAALAPTQRSLPGEFRHHFDQKKRVAYSDPIFEPGLLIRILGIIWSKKNVKGPKECEWKKTGSGFYP